MSKVRPSQWYNRMGGIRTRMNKPLSERVRARRHLLSYACVRKNTPWYEQPVARQSQNTREKDTSMNASSETWQLGDQAVQVSHLEKVFWPQTGFTKGDLLSYYRQIAPVALPYLKDRPVTLRVYPQGVSGTSYYLRDCPADAPDWLRRVQYQPKTVNHPVPLPLIDTAAGLLWFANQGAIEFHLWGSHLPDLTQPDLAIFDLDPGETASFGAVREAALRLHDALEQEGVKGYPKEKRLAMTVEDHPMEYRTFEGVIAEGSYGAGEVIVWDRGSYRPLAGQTRDAMQQQVREQLNRGEVRFLLFGEKLRGEFALIRQPRLGGNAWLLIKKWDQYASNADVTLQERSVLSGKRLGEAS
jgi:DNA ligase D-like protein (predicted 3'-phosphoesterase)